jgi:hypothetical protein
MLFLLLTLAGGCAATATSRYGAKDVNRDARLTQPAHLTATVDASGTRSLHAVRRGVVGDTIALPRTTAGWQIGNPVPAANIVCGTYHATQSSTGAVKCGVACSDNTYYSMDCNADIFAGGYDIVIVE